MPLEGKPLEAINEADLQALIDNQIAENKTIEYKSALPGNSDAQKTEFLADVSSFANASGGHLVYGMKEENGVPTELCGLSSINADAEILRLENMIRDAIEPRIPGISTRAIALQGPKNVAIVIRIPRSWALPHRVTYKGHGHFYSRNSAGKYRLDVSELRAAFGLSETATERIRNFRTERLSMIVAGETPVPLLDNAKLVVHILPFSMSDPIARFNFTSVVRNPGNLPPMATAGWNSRINLDGFLTYSEHSYVQLFRTGVIEAVDAFRLRLRDGSRRIPSVAYEKDIIEALSRYWLVQKQLGVEPPLFIMLSMLGVHGFTMGVGSQYFMDDGHPIERDALILPEVTVESFDAEPAEVMRPIFDMIWNACGWSRSLNYNQEGKWVER